MTAVGDHSGLSGHKSRSQARAPGGVPCGVVGFFFGTILLGDSSFCILGLGAEQAASSLLSCLLLITLVISFSTGTDLAERTGLSIVASGASEGGTRWKYVREVVPLCNVHDFCSLKVPEGPRTRFCSLKASPPRAALLQS